MYIFLRTGEIGANGKAAVACEVCGKKLADPSSLYRHRKIHSGDKPHKCPYCPRYVSLLLPTNCLLILGTVWDITYEALAKKNGFLSPPLFTIMINGAQAMLLFSIHLILTNNLLLICIIT